MTILVAVLLLGCAVLSARAAECITNSTNVIQTANIVSDINNIATNNLNPPLSNPLRIEAFQTKRIGFPSATFCIENVYPDESTHIKLSEIVSGADEIVSQCCPGVICQGGSSTVITHALGVRVLVTIQPFYTSC